MAVNITQKDKTLNDVIEWCMEQVSRIEKKIPNASDEGFLAGERFALQAVAAHCEELLGYSGSMPLEVPDDPDIRTLIHLIEQGVGGLPDDIIDWLAEDGLPSADLWKSLRFDRTGDPSRRIARSLSVAEPKRLISMSVGEIGIHQWRDGYRTREMEERR